MTQEIYNGSGKIQKKYSWGLTIGKEINQSVFPFFISFLKTPSIVREFTKNKNQASFDALQLFI